MIHHTPHGRARRQGARGGGRGRAENRAAKIESDLTLLKWMVGSNAGLTLVVLAFLLRGHA